MMCKFHDDDDDDDSISKPGGGGLGIGPRGKWWFSEVPHMT